MYSIGKWSPYIHTASVFYIQNYISTLLFVIQNTHCFNVMYFCLRVCTIHAFNVNSL